MFRNAFFALVALAITGATFAGTTAIVTGGPIAVRTIA